MTTTAKRIRRPPGNRQCRPAVRADGRAGDAPSGQQEPAGREVRAFLTIEPRQAATVPLMSASAACGFPSPADDYLDRPLDSNDLLDQKRPVFLRHLARVRTTEWVIYAKPPFAGPRQVLDYVGGNTHRIAISNNRLLAINDGDVRFRWKD
jgi:hypothetical protein